MISDSQLERRFPFLLVLVWLLCAAALLFARRAGIAELGFRDPDDALRLVQIRDWMAGQSWFDVTQYRINPPKGGPMHWSRLVDVPIATLLWIMAPLLGAAGAERVVLAVYPLLLLGLLFFLVGDLVRRLAGPVVALIAILLLAISFPVLIQLMPLRIDHHGWQIVMAALALHASLLPSPRWSGIGSGGAVAVWLAISGEALPYAVLFGGFHGLKYLHDRGQWDRLVAYLIALTVGSSGILLATQGWSGALVPYCDAMSPVYLLPLWVSTLLLLGGKALVPDGRAVGRLVIAAVAGAGGVAVLLMLGPECVAGPFETLDPFVYRHWYLHINEGLPLWRQSPSTIALSMTGPVLGLVGYALALRSHWGTERFSSWLGLLVLSLGALGLSLLVLRAMAVANVYMLPGNAWLLFVALRKARAIGQAAPRIVATVAVMVLIPAMPTAMIARLMSSEAEAAEKADQETAKAQCLSAPALRGLGALPPATLFAPLDIGPLLLVHTHHRVIATNHHRNQKAMAKVLKAFMRKEGEARRIVTGTGAEYLAYCPDRPEIRNYVKHNPSGLAALLESGRPPAWLKPVPMRKGEAIRLYQVVRQGR